MNIGIYGEMDFISYFSNRYEVEDLRLDESAWQRDIDFRLINKETGAARTVEIKTDNRIFQTENLFIETKNPRSQGGLGWFNFCQADLICYYDFVQKIFHIFSFAELKELVEELRSTDSMYVRERYTNDAAVGMLIPLEYVEKLPSYRRVYLYGTEAA